MITLVGVIARPMLMRVRSKKLWCLRAVAVKTNNATRSILSRLEKPESLFSDARNRSLSLSLSRISPSCSPRRRYKRETRCSRVLSHSRYVADSRVPSLGALSIFALLAEPGTFTHGDKFIGRSRFRNVHRAAATTPLSYRANLSSPPRGHNNDCVNFSR